tara:strand:+ start:726 stop:1547 length:822 start_codon:yes stop_codon:yes gene_type:complete
MVNSKTVEPLEQIAFNFNGAVLQPTNTQRLTAHIKPKINYQLIRSKRKTLSIIVKRASVIVRAPLKAPLSWIDTFVDSKENWIFQQVEQQKLQLKDIYRIIDHAIIPVLGIPLSLSINHKMDRERASIKANDDGLDILLTSPLTMSQDEIEKKSTTVFLTWLKKQARQYMSLQTHTLAKQLGVDKKLQNITYRRTKSKWGHCTSEGNIQYNPLIILAPLFVIDYIIAHEVCHLSHANHSKRFWQMVEKTYPQSKHAERWLDQHGHRLAIEANK